jgi:hypothetical protein
MSTPRLRSPYLTGRMADFLAVVGIVAFVGVMLGLIWALDRV